MSQRGLALLNGTQFMSSHAVHAILRARRLSALADKIGAMHSMHLTAASNRSAIRSTPCVLIQGQLATARAVRSHLEGSELINSPKACAGPYSFRCMPRVHGAVKDALAYAGNVIGARSALRLTIHYLP